MAPTTPAVDPMAPIDVQALASEVATARRLKLVHPIALRALPPWIMSERLQTQGLWPTRAEGEQPSETAFGFAPPGGSINESARAVLSAGVAGYYDPRTKVLYIRDATGDATRLTPQTSHDRDVLAHEIEHALQDQNFGLRPGGVVVGVDEALAYKALVEGDARLTEYGIHLLDADQGSHRISRIAWMLRTQMRKGSEPAPDDGPDAKVSAELRRAPQYVRRLLVFPYVEGTLFAAALHGAGGTRLIDAAFAHPPRTTEQVLHPDKYVAGEGAIQVATPAVPDGWHVLESGSLGELRTAVLLAQCLPRERADVAASGWGGDAWSVLANDGGQRAILWATVWDDEAAAARFEVAARARVGCLDAASVDPEVGREVLVVRNGNRVGYAQGLPDALRDVAARGLLALPVTPTPPQPPFAAVTIPPLVYPDAAFGRRGHYDGRVWKSEPLGIQMAVPDGFAPADDKGFEAAMVNADSGGFVGFRAIFSPPGAELEQKLVREVLAWIRPSLSRHGEVLNYRGDSLATQGAGAHHFRWGATLGLQLDLTFVPACDDRATILLVMLWNSYRGSVAVDRWISGFRLPSEDSPACLQLGSNVHDE